MIWAAPPRGNESREARAEHWGIRTGGPGLGNLDSGTLSGEPGLGLGDQDLGYLDSGNPAYREPGLEKPGVWRNRPVGNPDWGNPDYPFPCLFLKNYGF